MIITTTSSIEGKKIKDYKGIVFGEVILGTHFMKDFSASFRDFFGERVSEYESDLISARERAISEMIERADKMGANAIVGIKVDTEVINSMMMAVASGTAVLIEDMEK